MGSALPRVGALTPAPSEPVVARTADGWILRGERRPRPGGSVAVLGHAMMVDRRTLDRPRGEGLASVLAAHGLEVLVFDVRGHGESAPRAEQGGRWTYDDIVRYDVAAIVRAAREVAGGRKVIVLGHSLTAHAAMIAAGLAPSAAPDAIVAYAPNLWAPHLEPRPLARAAKGAVFRAWSAVTRARGYFDARGLRAGTDAEAAPYVEQFVSMWRSARLASPDGATDYEACLGRAALPVLAYSSRQDRLLARPESVARFLALMTRAEVTHRVLEGEGAPDHMGFVTSPRSRAIWEESAEWIAALG